MPLIIGMVDVFIKMTNNIINYPHLYGEQQSKKKSVNWFHIWIVVPTKKKYEQVILCPHNL